MLASLLFKLGLPLLGELVGHPFESIAKPALEAIAEALGIEPEPSAIQQKIESQSDTVASILKQLEESRKQEWIRMQKIAQESSLKAINQTAQLEIAAQDRFQRWARPSCIYAVALTTLGYGLCIVLASVLIVVNGNAKALELLTEYAPALCLALTPCGSVAGVTAWGRTFERIKLGGKK